MNIDHVNVCPGTLAEGYSTYSPKCIKHMFNGTKVSHILTYKSAEKDEKVAEIFIDNRKRISISGVQEKLSFKLENGVLRVTNLEEQGSYILKPVPRDLLKVDEVPANEHLTMQIAKQVYGINTAENALVFFQDGTPAYLTKRFDLKKDGTKWGIEDFATLAGKSSDNGGSNFKYDYSYEAVAELLKKYVAAWRIELERFFNLVVFNYLFSNGDAHLKNFSLLESKSGDYRLSPAYDLINTRLHVRDTDFALSKGLFKDDYKSLDYKIHHHPSRIDFMVFGRRIGMIESRIPKVLNPYLEKQPLVNQLVENSFLSKSSKRGYLLMYNTKRNYLNK